jgi:DNA-binding response OmpR family regulator
LRVLVVEDEQLLADAVATGLRREAMAVDVVYDGGAALERIGVNDYDVVVLDRDLPVVHGDDVCRQIVELGLPARVLMLTAAGDVSERVEGLELGADDYLPKPFAFTELTARVRALGRRTTALRLPDLIAWPPSPPTPRRRPRRPRRARPGTRSPPTGSRPGCGRPSGYGSRCSTAACS